MRRMDVPLKERECPGLKDCPMKQEGPDPCQGCKIKENISWQPKYLTTIYASLLTDYIEAFRPSPDKLTWLDFEIYRLFQTAKAEHEKSLFENKSHGRK